MYPRSWAIAQELDALGENIGVIIKCQREEVFDQMHRIVRHQFTRGFL